MTDPARHLLDAEAQAAEARERLSVTVSQLQARLDPKLLAKEARDASAAAARAGVDQARRNPGVIAGALGAAVLLLVSRSIRNMRRRRRAHRPVPAQPINHSA